MKIRKVQLEAEEKHVANYLTAADTQLPVIQPPAAAQLHHTFIPAADELPASAKEFKQE